MNYLLKDNITGNVACYKTTVKISRKKDLILVKYKALSSTLFSYSDKYNDELYKGDVVEIFISLGKPFYYYEFECAPNGTLFYGEIHNENNERTLTLLQNNCIKSKTKQHKNWYSVDLIIDLSKLSGDKNNISYNIFRIDTDGEKPEKHLFALNPTLCDTFHVEKAFIKLK